MDTKDLLLLDKERSHGQTITQSTDELISQESSSTSSYNDGDADDELDDNDEEEEEDDGDGDFDDDSFDDSDNDEGEGDGILPSHDDYDNQNIQNNNNNNNNNNQLDDDRISAWFGLMIFSIISLVAVLSKRHNVDNHEIWTIFVTGLSTLLSIIGVLLDLFLKKQFSGLFPEIILSALLVILWISGLPTIMNSNNTIAVSYTRVENANLYFGSWASFICIIYIATGLLRDSIGIDITNASAKNLKLWALLSCSLIVIVSSIRIYHAFDCYLTVMEHLPGCSHSKWGIIIGSSASVINIFLIVWQNCCDLLCIIFLMVLWGFGLAMITFGDGPGHSVGNLFFATWACFCLSMLLLFSQAITSSGRSEQDDDATIELYKSTNTHDNFVRNDNDDNIIIAGDNVGNNDNNDNNNALIYNQKGDVSNEIMEARLNIV